MKVGDLVKTKDCKWGVRAYPKSHGIITQASHDGTGGIVWVMWPIDGGDRPVRTKFLEVINESR
jgi:hypothetical protein